MVPIESGDISCLDILHIVSTVYMLVIISTKTLYHVDTLIQLNLSLDASAPRTPPTGMTAKHWPIERTVTNLSMNEYTRLYKELWNALFTRFYCLMEIPNFWFFMNRLSFYLEEYAYKTIVLT